MGAVLATLRPTLNHGQEEARAALTDVQAPRPMRPFHAGQGDLGRAYELAIDGAPPKVTACG